ncbi:hypothetical protein BSG1_19859 [Bacillus sp. SG-1]|nr:hypothetical protein BSG1_19859 [Bacillus sp. SG-1]
MLLVQQVEEKAKGLGILLLGLLLIGSPGINYVLGISAIETFNDSAYTTYTKRGFTWKGTE